MAIQETGAAIECSIDRGVASVVLARPTKMNAVTHAMWREIAALATRLGEDASVRVVLLTGAGDNFCAGADIGEFDEVRRDADTARAYEAANVAAFAAVRELGVPTIAAIKGVCFGGGFGLAAACDIRIATPDARFSVPAARLGLAYPHDAMIDIVHAAGPQMARFLTFSAARIDADTALRRGFLLEIRAAETLDRRAEEIARMIAENAPLSVAASKASIAAVLSGDAGAERARTLGDRTFDSADYAEGRAAYAERRKPSFSGR